MYRYSTAVHRTGTAQRGRDKGEERREERRGSKRERGEREVCVRER